MRAHGILCGLLLGGPLLAVRVQPALASQSEPPVEQVRRALTRFVEVLGRVREGDGPARDELARLADRLCSRFARCDARDVAAFYLGLAPDELAQGLADERQCNELRQWIVDAGEPDGLAPGESWADVQAELEYELESFVERTARHADPTPRARALALLALLEVERVEDALSVLEPAPEGLLDLAESHARASIAGFEGAGQITPQLEPLYVLGKIERAREDPRARSTFQRCLDLAERVGNDAYREHSLLGLVGLARDAGDLAQIDRYLARIATFRHPEESWPLAREHASRLIHDDRPEAAVGFLVRHPPVKAVFEGEWHELLAAAFLRSGDVRAAQREFDAIGSSGGTEFSLLSRANLDLARGDADEVTRKLAGSGIDAMSARGRAQACRLMGEAFLMMERPGEALDWLERALESTDAWSELQSDAPGGSVVGEWAGLHTVVLSARAYTELGAPVEAAYVLEEYQSRRLRHGAAHTLSVEELRAWAGAFELGLVTWGIGPDSGVVAWIGPEGDGWSASIDRGRRSFEQAVRRLREATIQGDPERVAALGREITAVLIPAGLRERLKSGARGGRVLLLLHGPLEALPLAVLELDGVPLDGLFTPLVLPGLPAERSGELAPPAPAPSMDWALLGGPVGNEGATRVLLPGANRELAALARVYPDAVYRTGATFVRAAVADALSGSTSVHIATHLVRAPGCDDPRMASIGLQLSNGEVLCAGEILELQPRLPLVVLTACETAGGRAIDAEGLHGVSRAFLEGGTRNVLVTLWPVEDGAAKDFALAFHGYLRSGAAPSSAARSARRDLREAGRPPVDWAAFRLSGRD